ncbi:hypothetical protein KKG90_05255, partial [Candidatus Bipolaricaulota bacterium]|nr:hypothetical protein [Candidatus Bipolaricaulota bacterium]
MKTTIRYASTCSLIAGVILLVASLSAAIAASTPTANQPDQEVVNLTAFARLYGMIRWFHPSDEAANADWDALALSGVQQMRAARDSTDLADRLEQFFKPIAPTVRVFLTTAPDLIPEELEMPVSDARLGV